MEMREPRRRLTRLGAGVIAVGLIAAMIAACNGGDGKSPPTAQPTGEGSPTPQPTGQIATSAPCQALASLDRYRYVSHVTLESPEELVPVPENRPTPWPTITRPFQGRFYFDYNIDAALIMPDRVDATVTAYPNNPFELMTIGDQRWISSAGQWQVVGQEYAIPYQPLDICNAIFPELNLDQVQGQKETVNNVSTRHHTFFSIPSGQAISTILGPESDMNLLLQTMNVEVWVAEKDGLPMRMDLQSSGVYIDGRQLLAHVRIELRDINDKDIKVEAPI
jgi:hypothetical protein